MANRRERFKKLYPKRLKNAVWNIQSIGKLSYIGAHIKFLPLNFNKSYEGIKV